MLALLCFVFYLVPSTVLSQTIHNVTVGEGGSLKFTPETIIAATGDFVQFIFVAKNHTATQSTFSSPCSPLIGSDGVTHTGFDTGFMPVRPGGKPIVTGFSVLSTDPLWFYCRHVAHCRKGMVFAINPPKTGNTFSRFKALAKRTISRSTTTSIMTTSTTTNTSTTVSSRVTGPNPTPVVHNVTVGGNSMMVFSPSNITAQPNDIVQFSFVSGNHTATQSTFSNPCVAGFANGSLGFDSGYMPVAANSSNFPTFNISVNDTSPVWVFCAQNNPVSHCGNGMVFVVNAVEDGPNNWAAFQSAAERFNGTMTPSMTLTSTSSSPSPSSGGTGGSVSPRYGVTHYSLAFVAFAIGALLM